MSRLLEDITRAQKARKKAEQASTAPQSVPAAAKADSPAPAAPITGDPAQAATSRPADTIIRAQRFIDLEHAAAQRMERDADALEQLKRREEEIARAAGTSRAWLEVETRQLELAQTLEAEHAKAALAAEAATQLEEQARQAAQTRLAAQTRANEAAQRLQQAEERRAQATQARLDAEEALAVAEVAHVVVKHNIDEIQEMQQADDADFRRLRVDRYRRLAANIVRGTSVGVVLLAFAFGVGVTALVGVWRSPAPNPAPRAVVEAGKSVRQVRPVLKMDRNLDAFAARSSKALPQPQKQ